MEKSLGVIEQPLEVIFELRYKNSELMGVYFAWVLRVTNFGFGVLNLWFDWCLIWFLCVIMLV